MKTLKSLAHKIVVPLIVAGLLTLFGMYSRITAVELEQKDHNRKFDEISKDLKVIRCLTGDKITCKVIGMHRE